MADTFSVWFYSGPTLGNIQECECKGVGFEEAAKWFKHHISNVTAQMGWTQRVIMTDSDDCIVAEWKYGQGIIWPKYGEPEP
jgi:hypothetical protein